MFVATPRIRNSATARRARRTAVSKSRPRQVSFTSSESKWALISVPVKLTCRGRDFETAVGRARRAVAEFRIRGVATNIPFLQAVLDDPDFRAGRVTTSFIEERPELLTARHVRRPRHRLLTYLADVTVNKPHGARPTVVEPPTKLPTLAVGRAAGRAPGSGSPSSARRASPPAARAPGVAVTDTTFRDAHQSLLATRVRTRTCSPSPRRRRTLPQLLSLECWGGATYDVALRFLAEDPWERLAALRAAVPNICLQMLLRGRNTVGYTPYPTEVTDAFVAEAARPASTSSGSSTRSTTSSRCGRRSTRCARPARPSPRSRSATPPTCPTRARSSTRWTTTSGWPSRSSRPARTSWRSRTWPACCARPRPRSW